MNRLFLRRCWSQSSGDRRGWRRYVDDLKARPTSHVAAFAILHELTAIIPFPLIYFPLKWLNIGDYLPLPMDLIRGKSFVRSFISVD